MDQDDVNDLHQRSLAQLLVSSQQQSALLISLTDRLNQMDTNQAQLQQAIANVPANNGPLDPRTGDRIGKPVAPPALRTLPEQPKLPDTTFNGNIANVLN